MARIIKALLIIVASVVGFVIVASIAAFLFFDPNDYRDEISAGVKDATGRDLTIEGELSLSYFPWLAVEVGRTELGNADGFSDQPFMRFENASLSVMIIPLLLRQEASIGTASIEGLVVNLEVAADGTTNWDDLAATEDAAPTVDEDAAAAPAKFDVGNIEVRDASISYTDAQALSTYSITNLHFQSGSIAAGRPFDLEARFDFTAAPDDLDGKIAIRGRTTMTGGAAQVSIEGLNVSGEINGITAKTATFNFDSRAMTIDTVAQRVSPGEMDFSVLGVSVAAVVEPFSYAGSPQPKAKLRVAEFSLKELLRTLDIEPPATADERALNRVSFSANAALGEESITLKKMKLMLDDSLMTGKLSLPITDTGAISFNLKVDTINLDRYMAPADSAATASDESGDDIEIPVDMIRSLNVDGSFRIDQAFLSGMEFTKIKLGLKGSDGKLRLKPLSAKLYEGTYKGDVRINAARKVPSISVNEKLKGVNLSALAKAALDQDNISGTINASFKLRGKGRNLAAIRKDLDGTMAFELIDGAWEGTDIWHDLRAARAMFRMEDAPRPKLPARTEFTAVSATGTVTDGIFKNDDLLIELPFIRLTGGGIVDLPAAEVNYSVEARVLDNPELGAGMTAAELKDFTKTVVPVRITGPLASPSFRPDIEAVFRQQVEGAIEEEKEKLQNRLLDRLLGGEGKEQSGDDEPPEEDLEEQLKNKLLKDLIGR